MPLAFPDGDDRLDPEELYILLDRATAITDTDPALRRADTVAMENLLAEPARYRGRLIRLTVRMWRLSRPSPGRKPIWWADCTEAESDTPLRVCLAQLPDGLAERTYPRGPGMTVVGLFHKLVRLAPDRARPGEPTTRLYPVLAANSLRGLRLETSVPWGRIGPGTYVTWGALAVLLAGYVIARHKARRHRRERPAMARPPGVPEGNAAAGRSAPGDLSPDGDVDVELVRQIRQYKADHTKDGQA